MPAQLSEPVEDQVRKYIIQNISPSEIGGYDPSQTDTTQDDFILITSDNDDYGDYYPLIYVSQSDNGPIIPNSGNTNVNGISGSGNGGNQYSVQNVTISVQAVENGPYLNSADYDDLVSDIYAGLHDLLDGFIQLEQGVWMYRLTPPTQTRSSDETDSGSTDTWVQHQGSVPIHIQYTP
jgi:hypothetical protein